MIENKPLNFIQNVCNELLDIPTYKLKYILQNNLIDSTFLTLKNWHWSIKLI